jgi:sialic acid synthase SpsE
MLNEPDSFLSIDGKRIGPGERTYFVADIAANHDGDLQRAIALIHMAAEAGADAAKFQHFKAETIVSDVGFKALGRQHSHQSNWKKSVFEVYRDASVDLGWTPYLKEECDRAGIAFMTSPYSLELVDALDPYLPAYKIGSGDITWLEIIEHIGRKGKPYILATGASTSDDVQRAVEIAVRVNPRFALLQCNTNYTASLENFKFIQLNVLRTYREMYPHLVLGLSDHTPGHATVLGAVALGARIIEKHFTDDVRRLGPDHAFSMDSRTWREMVDRTRELEYSLGTGVKKVEPNEQETVVLQRRAIRLAADIPKDATLTQEGLTFLRPCPEDALPPYQMGRVIGKKIRRPMMAGDYLRWSDIE